MRFGRDRCLGLASIPAVSLCLLLVVLVSHGAFAGVGSAGSPGTALPTSSGDLDVGNVTYTVTDVGAGGWFDPQAGETMGSGFVFGGGSSALFHAGLIIATASDDVVDACYGSDDNGATTPFDFGAGIPVELGSNADIDQHAFATFSYPPSDTPFVGGRYCVRQLAYAWSSSPDDDYVIVEFEITNTGDDATIYAGWYADWDIGDATANHVGYDAGRKLGYMWDDTGGDTNYYGIMLLSASPSGFRAVHNPTFVYPDGEFAGDPGFEDGDKWDFLTGFDVTSSDTPDDWSVLLGDGPSVVAAGGRHIVAVAMVAGTGLADLQANADAAQAKWDGGVTQPVMSRQEAADLVTADIITGLPEEEVLVGYGPLCLLPAGTEILEEETRAVTTTTDLSWFFWLDLAPFSLFAHPTRFVVVDAKTKAVSVDVAKEFWPVVEGVQLYRNAADREGSADRFYVGPSTPQEPNGSNVLPEAREAELGLRRETRRLRELWAGNGTTKGGLFVSTEDTTKNDWAKADIDCAYEVLTTETSLLDYGLGPDIPDSSTKFMNNPTKMDLCTQIEQLPKNLDKFYVYWSGHGVEDSLCMRGGKISGKELAGKLKSLEAKEYCIIIDACHSASLLDEFTEAGLTGFHMTGAASSLIGHYWSGSEHGNVPFTGSWFSYFLWECFREGLEGMEAFAWAESTLKAYSDSIFDAHPEWDKKFQHPEAGTVTRFTDSGGSTDISATPACSTLCFYFPPTGDNTTNGNVTVYCELDDGQGGKKWKVKRTWNNTTEFLGNTFYIHSFKEPGATGNYKVVPHSNKYPFNMLQTWLPDTLTMEDPSSEPVSPSNAFGWCDQSPDEFNFGLPGGGPFFGFFEDGLDLDQVPAFYGTPESGFFESLGMVFPLVIDPEHPWIYVNEDPFQGYVSPIVFSLKLADIFDATLQPATVLDVQVEAWQGGVPVEGTVLQAVRTPDGIVVEPWSVNAAILAEELEWRITPLSSDGPGGGAVMLLDSFFAEHPVQNPSSTGDLPPGSMVSLWPGAPNPFSKAATLRFAVQRTGPVRLTIHDVNGRLVRRLLDGSVHAGLHSLVWDGLDRGGRRAASGVYFWRVETGAAAVTRKIVLAR